MSSQQNTEKALYRQLLTQPEVAELGGRITRGATFGLLLSLGERPLGLWSVLEGQYAFRELANYEPVISVGSAEEALAVTLTLLDLCRQGWAERFGPLPLVAAAA
jgi:hypothetical protein